MATAYWTSLAVHAAASLGVADALRDGSSTADELASKTGAYAPTLSRLLRALVALGLLEEDAAGVFGLTARGDYLRSDHPDSIRAFAMVVNEPWFVEAWQHLLHGIRTGDVPFGHVHHMGFWDFCAAHPAAGALFATAMTGGSSTRAQALLAAYDSPSVRPLSTWEAGRADSSLTSYARTHTCRAYCSIRPT
jgi:hypothetical protein